MIKIVPTTSGVNISFKNIPVALDTLALDEEMFKKLIAAVKSTTHGEDGSNIAYFEYELGLIRFFRHFDNDKQQDLLVYVKNFPMELLDYLEQIERAISRNTYQGINLAQNETTTHS